MKAKSAEEKVKTVTLELRQVVRLLEDLEASNQYYKEFLFLPHCNSNHQIYGKGGDEVSQTRIFDLYFEATLLTQDFLQTRRAFQRKLNKFKNLTLQQYVRTLKKHNVDPGLQVLRQLEIEVQRIEQDRIEEEQRLNANTMSKDGLNDAFDRMSMTDQKPAPSTPQRPPRSSTPATGTSTPIFSPIRGSVIVPSSVTRFLPPASPSAPASPSCFLPVDATDRQGMVTRFLAAAMARQEGSIQHPYIIKVNYAHPERNLDMDVTLVTNVQHNDHMHVAFVIRKMIDPEDFGEWGATIPTNNYMSADYYGLEKSLVLIKGPSQSLWFRDTENFHGKDAASEGPSAIKAEHAATEIAIEADPVRRKDSYWLLVFSEDNIQLDNTIFSCDENTENVTNTVANDFVPLKSYHPESRKTFTGLAIVWKIGLEGQSQRIKKKQKEETVQPSLKDLFK
jgi:hypothetical protein